MDLLDRLLGHDAWTTRQVLARCRPLSDLDLDREFQVGHQSIRATLLHIIRNVEIWSDLMSGAPVRPNPAGEASGRTVPSMMRRLDVAAADLARVARAVAARGGWDELWTDHLDDPPRKKSFGGAIGHIITHSMHHRAQVLAMLRRLGVEDLPEGDLLSWEEAVKGRVVMSRQDFVIRHASFEDIETLSSLGARTLHDAYAAKSDPEELRRHMELNFTPAVIAGEMDDPNATFFLALESDVPIGYALLKAGPAPDCVTGPEPVQLSRIYLEQKVVGRGYGAALMTTCLEEARRLCCRTLWLSVWDQNERALAFYASWGFGQVGTYDFEFGGTVYQDPLLVRPVD